MSYSIRDQAQRKLKQAIGNIDNALSYLKWYNETYESEHPDLAEIALQLGGILVAAEEGIEELSRQF
jgi:hypothetical protein